MGRGEKTREILARSRAEVFRFFVSGMPLLTPACFFRKTLFAEPGERFNADYRKPGISPLWPRVCARTIWRCGPL